MLRYVVELSELDRARVAMAGGKGAGLGELMRVEGIVVPRGFCVTGDAHRQAMAAVAGLDPLLARLALVAPGDAAGIRTLSAEVRAVIEAAPVPDDVAREIGGALVAMGRDGGSGGAGGEGAEDVTWAVRSSATAEDLPTASFAGQHDSYLEVRGEVEVLDRIRACWASLFTERAVTYRLHHRIDYRGVHMAVVVQQMAAARASGVLFTADPVSGHRRVTVVEAVPGRGDDLVSGRVDPDRHRIVHRHGEIEGGIEVEHRSPEGRSLLNDDEVAELAALGRRIEAHFGAPQDIEWCLTDQGPVIVQARPITTLFPVPEAEGDAPHVYVSVGHQQMMTDPMKPLGTSMWLLTALRPMVTAGGRIFVDVAPMLASLALRAGIIDALGRSDPLMGDALATIVERGDLLPPLPSDTPAPPAPTAPTGDGAPDLIEADPTLAARLVTRIEHEIEATRRGIATRSGPDLFEFILADLDQLKASLLDPDSVAVITAAMAAPQWLDENLHKWLGEKGAADLLARSVPHNVTSEMGLALLDVADAIRPHPQVVELLRAAGEGVLDDLDGVAGGPPARRAIEGWLDRYGMRGPGEIDITRPRWSEHPHALAPIIVAHVDHFAPGESGRRFERGRREAAEAEVDLLARLRRLPDGDHKAVTTKAMIDRVRAFAGFREHPKYGIVNRYFLYKQALLAEVDELVVDGVLAEADDASFLTFGELADVVRHRRVDRDLIERRREAFRWHATLTPPRVLTSEGEAVAGSYRRHDLPPGALVGLGVSAGTVEGRARVVLDVAGADLEPGDVLVTTHTDPSWSPLFVGIAGLVTEVGGLMTHGAVVAREYGLPSVVGVEGATTLIPDGARIRVDGTDGHVEVLDTVEPADPRAGAGTPPARS